MGPVARKVWSALALGLVVALASPAARAGSPAAVAAPDPLPIPASLPPDEPLAPMDVAWQGLAGARAAYVHTGGPASPGNGPAVEAAAMGDAFGRHGPLVARAGLELAVGGGSGIERAVGGALFGGYRFELGERAGLVARIGGDARLAGDHRWYGSRLVVPELELGGQVLRSPELLDLVAHVGPMLAGQAQVGDASRALSTGADYGARLSLRRGLVFVRLDLDLTTPTHGFHDQALLALGRVCVTVDPIAICLDSEVLHGDETFAAARVAETALETGASFGVGF